MRETRVAGMPGLEGMPLRGQITDGWSQAASRPGLLEEHEFGSAAENQGFVGPTVSCA